MRIKKYIWYIKLKRRREKERERDGGEDFMTILYVPVAADPEHLEQQAVRISSSKSIIKLNKC